MGPTPVLERELRPGADMAAPAAPNPAAASPRAGASAALCANVAAARRGNKTLLFFGSVSLISTTQCAPPRARGSLLFQEPT